jgi:hypothetical protein
MGVSGWDGVGLATLGVGGEVLGLGLVKDVLKLLCW